MTELMKQYEAETDEVATWTWHNKEFVTDDVLDWAWKKIQTLGILNEEGCLPCPFCGEYPESFNKGNEYTKKRCSVLKCNKCHYELTVCAIYQTIEWCKEKVLYNWNRRA